MPQQAFAAEPFPASAMYATQTNSSNIVVVDRATGETSTVLTAPGRVTGLNQIGVAGDGSKLFFTTSTTVYEYTAATESWETASRAGTAVANTMGGVDPVTGLYYFGGQSNGNVFTFTTYNPVTNVVGASTIAVTADGAPGGNGDLAFDSLGNLYFVSGSTSSAQLYRVDAGQLGAGTARATRVGASISSGLALNSMAFANDGYLYIAGSGQNGFLRVNPITGAVLERRTLSVAVTDLATNAVPFTGSASVTLPGGRVNPEDQFTITIGGGGISTGNIATTVGEDASATVGPLLLLPGETYTIEQTPEGATDPNNYSTVWQCIDPATGAVIASGSGTVGEFTLPAGVQNVACSFTSTALTPAQAENDESLDNVNGTPVVVDVVANDQGDLERDSVRIITGEGDPVTELVVDGEGTWTVNTETGAITFTPADGFTGNPTPITYQVTDSRDNTVDALVTVTYAPIPADAADDESLNNTQGSAVTLDVLQNDQGDLTPGSVSIVNGDGNPVTELVVDGQGVWTVNPESGAITFTPTEGFTGNPTPITYQVTDSRDTTVDAQVTIAYSPVAVDDEDLDNILGSAVTVNVAGNDQGDLDPSTVRIIDGENNPVTELAVEGQGLWTVNPATGDITFTPADGYTGNPAPIAYSVTDTRGNTVEAEVTVAYVPVAADDEDLDNAQGAPVTLDVLANDQGDLDPSAVAILNGDGDPVTELVVDGQGVWTVNPETGAITFTPADGFNGNPTPITYEVVDSRNNIVEADVTVTYLPVATDDASEDNAQGTPVTLDVVGNDLGALDPSTVSIINGEGNPVTELVVPGEGTWTVNPDTGAITFTQADGFTGNPAPITYSVTDTRGNTVEADVTVAYLPVAADDEDLDNAQGTPVAVNVVANDQGALDPASVRILDGEGNPVTELVVDGQGTWTVNPDTGAITFTQADGFTGNPAPITYSVTDTRGNTVEADVTVAYLPVAADDEDLDNAQGTPVAVNVVANDQGALDPASVRILDGEGNPVTELVVDGQGTWTVNTGTGAITFTPADGFSGNPAPIAYEVTDTRDNTVEADVTVTYLPVATDDESEDNEQGTPVTIDTVGNDQGDLDPTSVRIIDGEGNPVTELVVPGEGTWTVNTDTGAITFTPEEGFSGNPTEITYLVTDNRGNTVQAEITVAYTPVAANDESLDNKQGTPAIVDVIGNDQGDLDPGSVRIIDGEGNPVTELVVAGQGTWTVNTETGAITFTPEEGFTGNPTPITYSVTDTRGNTVQAEITVAYTPVAANDESLDNKQGSPVTVDVIGNDQGDLNPGSVRIIDGEGNPVTELVVAGQGSWTVNTETGAITFTPANGFTGNPTPITYSVTDTRGNTVEAQVTVTYVPVEVVDDGGSNPVTDDGGSNPVTDDADKTPAKGGQPLADTGAKIGGAVTLALALLGAGLVLVLRRRQA